MGVARAELDAKPEPFNAKAIGQHQQSGVLVSPCAVLPKTLLSEWRTRMRGSERKYTIWIDRGVALGRVMRRCSQLNIVRWLFGGQTHDERTCELARHRGGASLRAEGKRFDQELPQSDDPAMRRSSLGRKDKTCDLHRGVAAPSHR